MRACLQAEVRSKPIAMLGVSQFARRKQAIPTCRIKVPEGVRAMLPEGQNLPQKRHIYVSKVRSGVQQSLASALTSSRRDWVDTPVVHAKGSALSFDCPLVQNRSQGVETALSPL